MPSSYLKWAQDFDDDGRKDIWTSGPDVFASIAFFLQQHGWQEGARWGREVKIPPAALNGVGDIPRREDGCRAFRAMTNAQPLKDWRTRGLRTTSGATLPSADITASLVMAGKRSFLLYDNYDALLGYNCAHTYALSVSLLSDAIEGIEPLPTVSSRPPKKAPAKLKSKSKGRSSASKRRTSKPRKSR